MTTNEPPDEMATAMTALLEMLVETRDVLAHLLVRSGTTIEAAVAQMQQGPAGVDQAQAILQTLIADIAALDAYASGPGAYSDGTPLLEVSTDPENGIRSISYPLWPARRAATEGDDK